MDPADLTATAALARMRAGQLSAPALVEACLARIAVREPALRAMAHLDADGARQAARAGATGRLQGLPLGVKDVLDTADMPSEYGSVIWAGHRPRADAAAIAWARAEGAIVMGKTVTTEFATRQPGPTANPHDPARTPGGSSSGSAAGVAAGFFPFAFGTQTAGSILRPAAYCGVVGYKPSFGMISRVGMKVMASGLDTVGVLARSVADCALLAGAVSGRELGDPDRRAERAPRVGLCRSPAWGSAAPETVGLMEAAGVALGRAGATVTEIALAPVFERAAALHGVIMNAESARAMGWELAHHRGSLSRDLRERLLAGLAQPGEMLDEANACFVAARAAFADMMDGYDVVVTPATAGEAPLGLSNTGDPAFNALWTGLWAPCVSVWAGIGPHGMPLALQLVGASGRDRATLCWAEWVAACYR